MLSYLCFFPSNSLTKRRMQAICVNFLHKFFLIPREKSVSRKMHSSKCRYIFSVKAQLNQSKMPHYLIPKYICIWILNHRAFTKFVILLSSTSRGQCIWGEEMHLSCFGLLSQIHCRYISYDVLIWDSFIFCLCPFTYNNCLIRWKTIFGIHTLECIYLSTYSLYNI